MASDRILILGASARAAAASARRAGLTPFAVDLFADRDTLLLCERVWRCPPDRYPEGLFELAKLAPPMPWMYTGGLENYPELVGALAKEQKLWGNGPDVLSTVRHPFALSALLSTKGLSHPQPLKPGTVPIHEGGVWLRKPVRGSGGGGIRFAEPNELAHPGEGFFLQEFVPGPSMSATFVGIREDCLRVGATSQLIGTEWLHARPFQYAGNVGLGSFSGFGSVGRQDVELTGFRLANTANVVGLFGIDCIPNGERCYTVEVNPRYTAAVEVLEHAHGVPFLDWHRRGCVRAKPPANPAAPTTFVGKAVYYAPRPITFPAAGPWDDSLARAADVWHRPDFADVPHPGDAIEPGQPVITLLTDAPTEAECVARLKTRAAELDRLFGHEPPPEEHP